MVWVRAAGAVRCGGGVRALWSPWSRLGTPAPPALSPAQWTQAARRQTQAAASALPPCGVTGGQSRRLATQGLLASWSPGKAAVGRITGRSAMVSSFSLSTSTTAARGSTFLGMYSALSSLPTIASGQQAPDSRLGADGIPGTGLTRAHTKRHLATAPPPSPPAPSPVTALGGGQETNLLFTAGGGAGGTEAENEERLTMYRALLLRRARVIGGVFGAGAVSSLAL